MSMQGSAMMYVTGGRKLYLGSQLFDDLSRTLLQRVLHQHLVEARLVRAPQACGVRMAPEPEDWYLRIRIRDVDRIDAADVGDHEIGPVDAVRRHEMVARKEDLQLPPEERVDPTEQDRRHGGSVAPLPMGHKRR